LARHYIPQGGCVYDIGASTGNIGRALSDTIKQRNASFEAIEESQEMVQQYEGPPNIIRADAISYDYRPFDFAICFLVLMFFPIDKRGSFIRRLHNMIKPGGAFVVFDKIHQPEGYFGTAVRRLTMSWKVSTGTPSAEIVAKELSLSGIQRPINPKILGKDAKPFFQFGEFGGWIIERPE
jgi:tRNA (cmo5U34)-methyltransferase